MLRRLVTFGQHGPPSGNHSWHYDNEDNEGNRSMAGEVRDLVKQGPYQVFLVDLLQEKVAGEGEGGDNHSSHHCVAFENW